MFVRLTLADVKEGEMDNALEYVKNTVMPSYDGISGLLGIAACATNDGRFMAWSTWANGEAKEASIDKFNQALAGASEMLDGQPEVMEGPMVAGQQYIMVPKDGEDPFFARFVLGGGTQDGKTYDDVAEFMTNTVYPAYENVDGIFGTAACKVDENSGFSFNFWTSHDAAHAASDVIADVVQDAVTNLIKEAPQELTGECNVWKNYVDFPVGKM